MLNNPEENCPGRNCCGQTCPESDGFNRNQCALFVTPVIVSFLALVFLLLMTSAAQAQTNNLLGSKAAKAFIARDYQLALDEFNALAEKSPHDLTIKRYQAICLDRLDRHDEAVARLKQVLLITSQAVSVHYHIATIYYKLQQGELAQQHFDEVISLGGGSKYDELAQVYLDAIASQRFNFLKPGAPKRWSLYSIIGLNSELGSRRAFDGEDRSGTRSSAYLSANYYYLRNHQWTGTIGITLFRSHHNHESLSDNDFKQWGIKTSLQRQTQVAGIPTIFRASLDYKNIKYGARDYSDGLSGSFNTRMRLTENTATSFYISYGQDKLDPLLSFDPDLVVTRQDLIYSGIDHSVYLNDRTIELGSGLFINEIDANSDNFNREGYGARVFSRFSLPYGIQLRLSATYREDDYPDFVGDRGFDSVYYGAGISRRLGKNFSLNLTYRKYDINYSEDFGDVDNSSVGMYLSYVY